MRIWAVHCGMNERRPRALADRSHDPGSLLADLEIVPAVYPVHSQVGETLHQFRDRPRRLLACGHGYRVAVVGYYVEHRETERARRVEAFPELALRSRAFTH